LPSGLYLRNQQTFGSLQQAPQLTHLPFLCCETGRMAVRVRLSLAAQVFPLVFL